MKRSRYTAEQVAFALRQAESGTPVAEVCRRMGITEQPQLVASTTQELAPFQRVRSNGHTSRGKNEKKYYSKSVHKPTP